MSKDGGNRSQHVDKIIPGAEHPRYPNCDGTF